MNKPQKSREEFEKKFVKPFQKNKEFNEIQLGAIEVRDQMMFDWFQSKLSKASLEGYKRGLDQNVLEEMIERGYHKAIKDWLPECKKIKEKALAKQKKEIIEKLEKQEPLKKGKWTMHPDWISRDQAIKEIKKIQP